MEPTSNLVLENLSYAIELRFLSREGSILVQDVLVYLMLKHGVQAGVITEYLSHPHGEKSPQRVALYDRPTILQTLINSREPNFLAATQLNLALASVFDKRSPTVNSTGIIEAVAFPFIDIEYNLSQFTLLKLQECLYNLRNPFFLLMSGGGSGYIIIDKPLEPVQIPKFYADLIDLITQEFKIANPHILYGITRQLRSVLLKGTPNLY